MLTRDDFLFLNLGAIIAVTKDEGADGKQAAELHFGGGGTIFVTRAEGEQIAKDIVASMRQAQLMTVPGNGFLGGKPRG